MVLISQPVGENDRLCTLLTERYGLLRCFAKGARRLKNKNFPATSQLVYGRYELFEHKEVYHIDQSFCEELYHPITGDLDKLALAQYLCELAAEFAPQDEGSGQFLLLMRIAMYLLSGSQRPNSLIKAAAELKMLSMSGYMPDLVMCGGCGRYDIDMLFLPLSGQIRCADCGSGGEGYMPLSLGALTAMRHIVLSDLRRCFSFELTEGALVQLSNAAESYLLSRVEHSFTTLDFYHSLAGMK